MWRDGSLRGVRQGRLGCSLRTSATLKRGPRHRAHRAGGLPYSIAGRRRRFLSQKHGQPLESESTDLALVEGNARDMHALLRETEDRTQSEPAEVSVCWVSARISQDTVERCSRWQLGQGNEDSCARKEASGSSDSLREYPTMVLGGGKMKNGQCYERTRVSAVGRCSGPKIFWDCEMEGHGGSKNLT